MGWLCGFGPRSGANSDTELIDWMPRCVLLCLRYRQGSVGAVCGSSDVGNLALVIEHFAGLAV